MRKQKQYAKHLVEECPYCPGIKPEIVRGDTIYPHLPHLGGKKYWQCPKCKAYVGCHDGTTLPLGRLANRELRKAKSEAHRAFDDLWKLKVYRTRILGLGGNSKGQEARYAAYGWLAERMGLARRQCHIGMFDIEQCTRVIQLCSIEKAKYGESLYAL